MEKKSSFNTYKIAFVGMMAAVTFVVTYFRFPLLGSKVHFANAMCLLAGLLLGPVTGGLSAGLGSALYDVLFGGYDFLNAAITFVSKFAMAWVCGAILASDAHARGKGRIDRTALACLCGALTYVALYMLKTFIYQKFVYSYPMDAVWATMVAKLIPSLINAAVAVVAAPLFYLAVLPALRSSGILSRMNPQA